MRHLIAGSRVVQTRGDLTVYRVGLDEGLLNSYTHDPAESLAEFREALVDIGFCRNTSEARSLLALIDVNLPMLFPPDHSAEIASALGALRRGAEDMARNSKRRP